MFKSKYMLAMVAICFIKTVCAVLVEFIKENICVQFFRVGPVVQKEIRI